MLRLKGVRRWSGLRAVLLRKPWPQARAASSFSAHVVLPRGIAAPLGSQRASNYFRSASASYFVPGRTGHESSAFGPRVLSTIRRPITHSSPEGTLHRVRQRGPSPGLKVSPRGSLGTSSSRQPLGHVGALGLRPHNYALQRTRVPSSRFFSLHGSPLNAISLDGANKASCFRKGVELPRSRRQQRLWQGHRSPRRAAARLGRARQASVLSRISQLRIRRPIRVTLAVSRLRFTRSTGSRSSASGPRGAHRIVT